MATEQNKGDDNGEHVEQESSEHNVKSKKEVKKKLRLPMKPADRIKHWKQVADIAECVLLFGCISDTYFV